MSKLTTLFTVVLLFSFMLTYATARTQPTITAHSLGETQAEEIEAEKYEVEESCEGIGKEECLMKRSLAAHVDYIYTRSHKP